MMFQAFAQTTSEIGAQQASLYKQEAGQVLSLGLDYDEQTKRLNSLKGKYTFGLMTNPAALVPTPTEYEYNQQLADQTKHLQEKVVLDEIGKRISTADNYQAWEGIRDKLASTLGDTHSREFEATMKAISTRAQLDFTGDRMMHKEVMNEYGNRNDNNFLDSYYNPTPENYDELVETYRRDIGDNRQSRAFISNRLGEVLKHAGSVETVQAVIKKYNNLITPQDATAAMQAAQQRAKLQTGGETLGSKLTTEARSQHLLGLPVGVDPRYIESAVERENEAFLSQHNLAFVAPETIEWTEGGPLITSEIATRLRNDLRLDPFKAVNDRGLNLKPSPLTLPGPDGSDLDKYSAQMDERLKVTYQLRNEQYGLSEDQGTGQVIHGHTAAENEVLRATYEQATPMNKARLALAEANAYRRMNDKMKWDGQKMDVAEALPFKDKDAEALIKSGISDQDFMAVFPTWIKMREEDKSKAEQVIMAYSDTLNADASANNVYDDVRGVAIIAAARSGQSLLDLSANLTGKGRAQLSPAEVAPVQQGMWRAPIASISNMFKSAGLEYAKTRYSTVIVNPRSPLQSNINKAEFSLTMIDPTGNFVDKKYKFQDLLDSNGELEKDGTRRPLGRLVPADNGSSITKFIPQYSRSIQDANAGVWWDIKVDGKVVYLNG